MGILIASVLSRNVKKRRGQKMNPNPDNYGTLEACQRLQAAGIVLETEAWWNLCGSGKDAQWRLERVKCPGSVPAPCFTEVWRELPERQTIYGCICEIIFTKVGPLHLACYSWIYEAMSPVFKQANPIDTLIDLLIFVIEQRKEKV